MDWRNSETLRSRKHHFTEKPNGPPARDGPPAISAGMFSRRGKKPSARRQTPRGRALSALVRIDQKFLAGRALGIDRDVGEIERLLQRHHLGVVAREGGLKRIDYALAQPFAIDRPDLHQEGKQEPATDAPGHAERPVQFDRTRIETAIDVDLLVHARSVAAIDLGALVG